MDHSVLWAWIALAVTCVPYIFLFVLVCVLGPVEFLTMAIDVLVPEEPGLGFSCALVGVIAGGQIVALPGVYIVCFLPGLVFGFWRGMLITFCGMLLGVAIVLALGRVALAETFRKRLESAHNRSAQWVVLVLKTVERQQGHAIVFLVLLRFLMIPAAVKNYVPCMLDIPYWKLVLSGVPGHAFTSAVCASGSAIFEQAATELRHGDGRNLGWRSINVEQIVVFVVSCVALILMSAYAYGFYQAAQAFLKDLPDDASERTPLLGASPGAAA